MSVWFTKRRARNVVSDTRIGYLIDGGFDGYNECAILTFVDPRTSEIFKWKDPTGHLSYLLTDASKEEVLHLVKNKIVGVYETVKYDAIQDKAISLRKVMATNPQTIGYSYDERDTIRKILLDNGHKVWEAWIRYHNCYCYDNKIEYGMPYLVESNRLIPYVSTEAKKRINSVVEKVVEFGSERTSSLEHFVRLMETDIPNLKIASVDIEVLPVKDTVVPDAKYATEPIIAVSFVDSIGKKDILLLERAEKEMIPVTIGGATVKFFRDEVGLLNSVLFKLQQYPIIISFNGDDFDLTYIYNRAVGLGILKKDIPLYVGKGKTECTIKTGVHLDLYTFLKNESIRNYAFKGVYKRFKLNDISEALLGKGKIHLEKPISQLDYAELGRYCLNDAVLTYELATFDNGIVLNLIFALARIANLTLSQVCRNKISSWVRSTFYYFHRMRNILIPNQEELLAKGDIQTKAIIEGKKYKGAIVKTPQSGARFKVIVMDYQCLDEETEVLTRDGWKKGIYLNKNEEILTFHKDRNILEYQPIDEIFKYNYNGDMVSIDMRYINFRSTPNHRVIFKEKRRGGKEWRVSRADSLKTYISIPCSAPYYGGETRYLDDEIRLFAWLITEGEFTKYGLKIYQSEGEYVDEIRELLRRLKIKYTETSRTRENKKREYVWHILVPDCKKLKTILYNEKRLTKELLNLPYGQLDILLNTMMKGDGCRTKYTYTTSDSVLATQVQELAIKLGRRGYIYSSGDEWLVGIVYTNEIFLGLNKKRYNKKQLYKKKFYSGVVWCPNVKNGFFLARRNNKHFITGNSLYPSEFKMRNVCYSTINCGHKICASNLVPFTSHYICTKRRGITSEIIGVLRDIRVGYYKDIAKKHPDPTKRAFYSAFEQALKVFSNASYGVFGSENFALYTPPVAEAIAAYGRRDITAISERAEGLGINVFYLDTDSLFLDAPSHEQTDNLIKWALDELKLDINIDKVYKIVFFSDRKKNYLGVFENNEIDEKGLLGKKINIPDVIKETYNKIKMVLVSINEESDIEPAKKKMIEIAEKEYKKLKNGDFDVNKLAFHTVMKKDVDGYNTNVQHVRVAKMLIERGYQVSAGDVIDYVKAKTPEGVIPILDIDKKKVNVEAYIDQLETVLAQIFDPLDIDFEYSVRKKPKPTLLADFLK